MFLFIISNRYFTAETVSVSVVSYEHIWLVLIFILTHFMPLVSFYTPWKHWETFNVFRWYRKRPLAWNGIMTSKILEFSRKVLDYTSFVLSRSKSHMKSVLSMLQSVGLLISLSTVFLDLRPLVFFQLFGMMFKDNFPEKSRAGFLGKKISFCGFQCSLIKLIITRVFIWHCLLMLLPSK